MEADYSTLLEMWRTEKEKKELEESYKESRRQTEERKLKEENKKGTALGGGG